MGECPKCFEEAPDDVCPTCCDQCDGSGYHSPDYMCLGCSGSGLRRPPRPKPAAPVCRVKCTITGDRCKHADEYDGPKCIMTGTTDCKLAAPVCALPEGWRKLDPHEMLSGCEGVECYQGGDDGCQNQVWSKDGRIYVSGSAPAAVFRALLGVPDVSAAMELLRERVTYDAADKGARRLADIIARAIALLEGKGNV